MIYLYMALLIGVLCFDEITSSSHRIFHKNKAFVVVFITLLVIASSRINVGDDWNSYAEFYINRELSGLTEIGYRVINDFFGDLGLHYNIFLLFINTVILFFIFKFIKENAELKQIGLLIFFYDVYFYLNLSGVRQGIALAVTCFGFNYALKKDFFKYLLVVLIASTFHKSALIALIIYFIPRDRFDFYAAIKSIKFYLVLCVIIIISNAQIESYIQYVENSFFKNVAYYALYHPKSENILIAYLVGLAKRSIVIYYYYFYCRYLPSNHSTHYLLNIYIVGFILFAIIYLLSPDIGTRLSIYFSIFEILIIGNLIYFMPRYKDKILILITYFSVTAIKLFDYMNRDSYQYHSILFNIM